LSEDELHISNYVNEIMKAFQSEVNNQEKTPSSYTKKNQVVTKDNPDKEELVIFEVAKTGVAVDHIAEAHDRILRQTKERKDNHELMLKEIKEMD